MKRRKCKKRWGRMAMLYVCDGWRLHPSGLLRSPDLQYFQFDALNDFYFEKLMGGNMRRAILAWAESVMEQQQVFLSTPNDRPSGAANAEYRLPIQTNTTTPS